MKWSIKQRYWKWIKIYSLKKEIKINVNKIVLMISFDIIVKKKFMKNNVFVFTINEINNERSK